MNVLKTYFSDLVADVVLMVEGIDSKLMLLLTACGFNLEIFVTVDAILISSSW